MKDKDIISLYFARSEDAISETDKKYGGYCRALTYNILGNPEDSEECVNDTYMRVWERIPPEKPVKLGAFVARIARNLAMDMLDRFAAAKRGGNSHALAYEEISECVPSKVSVEASADEHRLAELIEEFVTSLPWEKRTIFMKRYYHFCSVSEIAEQMLISESKVKMTLQRTRAKLKEFLEKEGITL